MTTPNDLSPQSAPPHVVRTEAQYVGHLRCQAQHLDSGVEMVTAAPVDNAGDGSSFSPTDLVGVALGTCILTTMAIAAKRDGFELSGAAVAVEKEMTTKPVRRIGRLRCQITLPPTLNDKQVSSLRHAAESCPVHRSLHPDLVLEISYI